MDKSPVTIADFGGQAIINAVIRHYFPEDIVVGEEESKDLASNPALFTQVLKVLEEENLRFTPKELLEVIDFGKRGNSGDDHAGAGKGRFWTIDPVDGTKGFLRGGQYAVGVALIEDGEVQLGVVGAPNLACKETSTGCLFYATKGGGAFEEPLDMSSPASQIAVSGKIDPSQVKFSESFDASHSSQTDTQRIAASLGITAEPVRMDSMCKYMMVARGDAEIFIRLPVKGVDYIEKIWDHAAGTLIVQESGGIVTDMHGNKLDFEQGRLLSKNDGIVATNSLSLHQIILDEIHRLE